MNYRLLPPALFGLLLTLTSTLPAQNAKEATGLPLRHKYLMEAHSPQSQSPVEIITGNIAGEFSDLPSQKVAGACITPVNAGSSSNIFSIILGETNQVVANNALNTVLFIHRNNAGTFGGHSGNLRYDISTNGGVTWTNDLGPLNPASVNGTNAARYPNISLYNPAGNSNPSNAYLVYQGATVASTWNGIVSGVRRLNGTGNTENYNQAASSNTLIPRSQVEGAPGIYWAIDLVWNGTTATGFRIMKGVFNTGTNTTTWTTQTTLNPTFVGTAQISDFNIAFDPTGQIGWVGALTHISGGPGNGALYPVFWKTTNGGTTWGNPTTVDIGAFPCISSNITTGNVASTAFDMDLTVDMYGNPHMAVAIANGNNAYAVFFTDWHAVYDITQENGLWNAIELGQIYRGRGYFGTTAVGDTVTQDMQCQASRTEDGSKVFFLWVDSDTNATTGNNNNAPDLFGIGINVVTKRKTLVRDFTTCNPTFNNLALFPKAAPTVLGSSNNYEIPVVIGKLNANGSTLSSATFHYFDNADFSDGDFSIPVCGTTLAVTSSGPTTFCQGGSITLDAGTGHDAVIWSNGSTSQSIAVSQAGTYICTVRNGCCTASDTVTIAINPLPMAGFSSATSLFTVNFSDTTNGNPSAWIWDFGDGSTSTQQNPTHTYANAGTYTVCLIATNACGSDTICRSVGIACSPSTPSFTFNGSQFNYSFFGNSSATVTWLWDFGDGATSTFQNPLHTYAATGNYTVCLTTTDSCGTDSICQVITVSCPVPAPSFTYTSTGLLVAFTDGTTGAPNAWAWDFGDGNQSTLANPTHSYANFGTYTVCLNATNDCGQGTQSCQTLDLLVGMEAALGGRAIQVYPNPAEDRIFLQLDQSPSLSMKVTLLNALGQRMRNAQNWPAGGAPQMEISVSDLATGMYFLQIESEIGTWTHKVQVR